MLSLVQNLVPPAGVYNLGTHRTTVKRNQIAKVIYALRILKQIHFVLHKGATQARMAQTYLIHCVCQLKKNTIK